MGKKKTIGEIRSALKATSGFQTKAAKLLGITRQAVNHRIRHSHGLTAFVKDIEEARLDMAEDNVSTAIQNGERWATCYYLDRKGKERGYVQRQEVTGADGKDFGVIALPPKKE